MFRRLDAKTLVAGQITVDDLSDLKARGVTTLVNNRPDGEEPGQPSTAEINAAAQAAGMAYHHIPIASGFSEAQVAAMAGALEGNGRLLAFCRSGTRSTFLWALAEHSRGRSGEELIARAAEAGYDLAPIAGFLRA